MSNFISTLSGCGRFSTREDKDLVAAVRRRRQALRMVVGYESYQVQPRPVRVALHSRAHVGSKSEAELLQALISQQGG